LYPVLFPDLFSGLRERFTQTIAFLHIPADHFPTLAGFLPLIVSSAIKETAKWGFSDLRHFDPFAVPTDKLDWPLRPLFPGILQPGSFSEIRSGSWASAAWFPFPTGRLERIFPFESV
jgi:hypothetical protein